MSVTAEIPEVSVEEAATQLATGAVMIDVREPGEWQAGRVSSARHIPLGDLPYRLEELESGTTLLVMCRSGMRSAEATVALNSKGFDAHNIVGGMKAWVAAGKPIEPESGFVA